MAPDVEAKGFEHMGLDGRLLRAVAELGWAVPTAIQAQAIPLAMEGRDLLARARTGSGKTGAYGLPLLHKLLGIKEAAPAVPQAVRALVLVPSAELARQVGHTLRRLCAFCGRRLRVAELCGQAELAEQRPVLMEQPDVVVGTPGRVLAHVAEHNLSLRPWLELLVLDEADLLLSFGFGDDIKVHVLPPDTHLPGIPAPYPPFWVSDPKFPSQVHVLPPEPRLPGRSQLQQFQVCCDTEEDKFLLLAALLKLRLLRGRALLFVGSLARAFRLKLFLEQFGIAACTLNPQLPARSRCHVIAQFNRGLYDYIVATDEEGPAEKGGSRGQSPQCPQDPEFSASRGIDFQNVAAVVNFDVPSTVESYIHRVGRCVTCHCVTWRSPGGHQCSGVSLTVSPGGLGCPQCHQGVLRSHLHCPQLAGVLNPPRGQICPQGCHQGVPMGLGGLWVSPGCVPCPQGCPQGHQGVTGEGWHGLWVSPRCPHGL
uniref:RNA helicase n=1 Tax=Catharus ustulatus TaxID=91951 RepID=A0A8C3UDD6_CATUS